MKATQDELPLRDPRKRKRSLQMELPFDDKRGRKAKGKLERHLGVNLKSFKGRIRGMDGTEAVVIAHDAGEAKSLYYREIQSANYHQTKFTDIQIARDKARDQWADKLGKGVMSAESADARIAKL
jgi:hypothetical protein